MKETVTYLQKKNMIFKSFKALAPKDLNSRKKIKLFIGVNLKDYYTLVIEVKKKSRILKKEVLEYRELHLKAQEHIDSNISKKYIIIYAPLCSKAKTLFEEHGWKVWEESS